MNLSTLIVYIIFFGAGIAIGIGLLRYITYYLTPQNNNASIPENVHLSDVMYETDEVAGLQQYIFHDERWERERNRFKHRRLRQKSMGILPLKVNDEPQEPTQEISFSKGTVKFNVKAETDDEMSVIHLDPVKYNWTNYSWQFSLKKNTNFRELGFYVRYKNFINRYRYRFENDLLYFDKIVNGIWYNNIASVPFPLTLGVSYDVRLDAYNNVLRCYVDGVLKMENADLDKDLMQGTIAIIIWENDKVTDMVLEIGPMSVRKLELDSRLPKGN